MQDRKSREIRLKRRPQGLPSPDDFELVEVSVSGPGPGQVLVRNAYISVDPYMRGRMVADRRSYIPPFPLGEALTGGAVGQVVESDNPQFKPGDYVQSMYGWREWYVAGGAEIQEVEPSIGPLQSYLGALGMPGLTAYVGLLKIAELQEGERVFVSAASGAVGAVACQIAKNKGCYVVGSAGSDDKCNYLTSELGIDRVIHYKNCGDLTKAVAAALPEGIDVYFDNVGGAHLEAALANMRQFGRIAACGMIEQYNATEPVPGPRNLIMIVALSLTLRGFIVSNYFHLMPEFLSDMGQWVKAGKMQWRDSVVEGIENAPQTFIGLFKGENFGKALVKVGPDQAI